jgi:hypothetical protein
MKSVAKLLYKKRNLREYILFLCFSVLWSHPQFGSAQTNYVDCAAPKVGIHKYLKLGGNEVFFFGTYHISSKTSNKEIESWTRQNCNFDTVFIEVDPHNEIQTLPAKEAPLVYPLPESKQQFGESSDYENLVMQFTNILSRMLNEFVSVEKKNDVSLLPTDDLLLSHFKQANTPLFALESSREQFNMFRGLTAAELAQLIKLNEQDLQSGKAIREISNSWDAWLSGDEKKLLEITNQSCIVNPTAIKFCKVLINDRNEKLADRISLAIKSKKDKRVLIIIGAGHLIGEKSLNKILVKRLSSNK